MSKLRYAVDLITFFDPGFWNLADVEALKAFADAQPRAFWTRMLDALAEAGVEGIELTFSPFGLEDGLRAFGSASAFRAELEGRGLSIASGFFADVAIGPDILSRQVQAAHLERAAEYVSGLADFGAEVLVMGLPMRTSWFTDPAFVIDLPYMSALADFCNRLGVQSLRKGVRLALHTEAHSVFSLPRDIDLLLLLTDPVYVSFCPDTAHILLSGGDPLEITTRHRSRMIIAHWKDATGSAPWNQAIGPEVHLSHRPYFRALGDGKVDWRGFATLLRDMRFEGWGILEIDATPDPVEETKRSMRFVAEHMEPIYARD